MSVSSLFSSFIQLYRNHLNIKANYYAWPLLWNLASLRQGNHSSNIYHLAILAVAISNRGLCNFGFLETEKSCRHFQTHLGWRLCAALRSSGWKVECTHFFWQHKASELTTNQMCLTVLTFTLLTSQDYKSLMPIYWVSHASGGQICCITN